MLITQKHTSPSRSINRPIRLQEDTISKLHNVSLIIDSSYCNVIMGVLECFARLVSGFGDRHDTRRFPPSLYQHHRMTITLI